jgi:hypothetical protein
MENHNIYWWNLENLFDIKNSDNGIINDLIEFAIS